MQGAAGLLRSRLPARAEAPRQHKKDSAAGRHIGTLQRLREIKVARARPCRGNLLIGSLFASETANAPAARSWPTVRKTACESRYSCGLTDGIVQKYYRQQNTLTQEAALYMPRILFPRQLQRTTPVLPPTDAQRSARRWAGPQTIDRPEPQQRDCPAG